MADRAAKPNHLMMELDMDIAREATLEFLFDFLWRIRLFGIAKAFADAGNVRVHRNGGYAKAKRADDVGGFHAYARKLAHRFFG